MKDLMEMLKKLTDYLEKCEGKLKSGCLSIRQKDIIEGEINATKYAISYTAKKIGELCEVRENDND